MRKIVSIILLPLFLLSNFGLVLSAHMCSGEVVESVISFAPEGLSCGMSASGNEDKAPQTNIDSKNCCENSYRGFQIKDKFKMPKLRSEQVQAPLIAILYVSLTHFYSLEQDEELNGSYYTPPLLSQDVLVLIQSFLL